MTYSPFRTKKSPIVYSEEFRKAVLKAYPNHEEIKLLLNKNEYFLGRYLDDGSNKCVPAIETELIIEMIESGKTEELLEIAKKNLEKTKEAEFRVEVYRTWDKEVFLD